jgi:site-specific recombinase XerD
MLTKNINNILIPIINGYRKIMSNIVTNVKNLELETIKNLKNSKAHNTLRAYQADFNDFTNFCNTNGFSSLPTDPKIVALYLTHLSSFSKFSTLKRRLASIKVIHKLKGHYIDTKHPVISENLMGIKRKLGVKQLSKKPILISDLKLIVQAIIDDKNEYKKIQNKALILIGFAGGFRRSELVSIEREDIDFVDEGVKINIRKSKTDQTGIGMTKAIPYFDNKIFCPVISLNEWINYANISNGKIFNISDKSVALIIKKYALIAGLDNTKYAGHSLRSGFATSTAATGADERSIMAMTGHKTTQMVRRYIQEANLFKNNALNKIKI